MEWSGFDCIEFDLHTWLMLPASLALSFFAPERPMHSDLNTIQHDVTQHTAHGHRICVRRNITYTDSDRLKLTLPNPRDSAGHS